MPEEVSPSKPGSVGPPDFATELRALLGDMRAAEAAGQREAAIAARDEILALRLGVVPHAGLPEAVTRGDIMLLYNQGLDQRALGHPAEAMAAWELAVEYAGYCGAEYTRKLLGLLGVHCLIDQIHLPDKLAAAGRRLREVLGEDSEHNPAAALGAARLLSAVEGDAADRYALRLEALHALGRYHAAAGHLLEADRAYSAALALVPDQRNVRDQSSLTVLASELAVLLHEIRLDRGDFAGCERLRAEWIGRPLPGIAGLKWRLLHGTMLHLRARLTEANDVFAELIDGRPLNTAVTAERPLLRAARWQQNHVLCALNRIDEAEAALHELAREGGWDEGDLRAMAAIQAAHRLGAVRDLPLTAREMLTRERRETGLDIGDALDPEVPLYRTRERVRDEWARVHNAVLLDLHHGRLSQAQERFTWLENWATGLASDLLLAQLWHLRGLLRHQQGRLTDAYEAAGEALRRYMELGLLDEERAVCRLALMTLERLGAEPEQRNAYMDHAQHLQHRIEATLSAVDRILYRLNKWSEEDRRLGVRCTALREAQGAPLPEGRWTRWREAGRRQRQLRGEISEILWSSRGWEGVGRPEDVASNVRVSGPPSEKERIGRGPYGAAARQVAVRPWGKQRPDSYGLWPGWLPRDTALLGYLVLPDRLERFLLTPSGWSVMEPMPTSRVALWPLVRGALTRLWYDQIWEDTNLQEALGALATALGLPNVLAQLAKERIRRLCVTPDDVLFHVPFAALPGEDGAPLLSRFAVSLLPNLEWSLRCPHRGLPLRYGLGVAVEQTQVHARNGREFRPLTHARGDIDALAAVCSNLRRLPGDAGDADCDRVLDLLPMAQVAAFSCHSDFDAENPHASGLILHDDVLQVADLERRTV